MSLNIQEKYSELKEELNGKNPFVKYNLLREELDNKDPIKRYVRIKEELDFIKEENVRKFEEDIEKREKNTLESLENLFESLGGDEEIIEATEDGTDELITQYKEITPGEKSKSEKRKKSSVDKIVNAISKQEEGKEKLQEQTFDPVFARIEKLEKWIQKIAVAGPGSGEVRLLNLDDVDTTDLANNKTLKYNSSTGKFVFGDAGGQTIQNAGSDLTTRTNLNFDGTYLVAADDSSNDQTDITLNRSNITALANLTTVGFGVTSGSTSITTALTNIPLNTELLDTPDGYLSIIVSGTTYKIPYYT